MTADFFPLLGIDPLRGRLFTREEDRDPGQVVLISYRLWQSWFGGDSEIIGRKVQLNSLPVTIIGVLPRGFYFLDRKIDLWGPLGLNAAEDYRRTSGRWLMSLGRLRPGVKLSQAQGHMTELAARLEQAYPGFNKNWTIHLEPLRDSLFHEAKTPLLVLIAAVHAAGRRLRECREFAARSIQLASPGDRGARCTRSDTPPSRSAVAHRKPAAGRGRRPSRRDPRPMVRERIGGSGAGGSFSIRGRDSCGLSYGRFCGRPLDAHRHSFWHRACNGGLAIRSHQRSPRQSPLWIRAASAVVASECGGGGIGGAACGSDTTVPQPGRARTVNPGMDPSNLLTFRVSLLDARYEKAGSRTEFLDRVLAQLGSLPASARAASAAGCVPFTGGCYGTSVNIEGRPPAEPGEALSAAIQIVMFALLPHAWHPLESGRDFTAADNIATSPYRFMVNEAFVKRYLRGEQPLGKKISVMMENRNPFGEIIGVVADAREISIDREAKATVYYVHSHLSDPGMYFLVRAGSNPMGMAEPAQDHSGARSLAAHCRRANHGGGSWTELLTPEIQRMAAFGASPPWPWRWRQSGFYGVVAFSYGAGANWSPRGARC